MKLLYYAHSRLSYGTRKEKQELRLIKKRFPEYHIVNPNGITFMSLYEDGIMDECKSIVRQVQIIVASEYNKHIGRGVFEELSEKTKAKKYLLRNKEFIENFSVRTVDGNDWKIKYGKCEGMMKIVCAWCGKKLGEKEGEGIFHGICKKCKERVLREMDETEDLEAIIKFEHGDWGNRN